MRSVSGLADVSINTISKLLEDAGRFCASFHYVKVRGVKARRVQVDEAWRTLRGPRQHQMVPATRAGREGFGMVRYAAAPRLSPYSVATRWRHGLFRHSD
jgi:hypothetical protein